MLGNQVDHDVIRVLQDKHDVVILALNTMADFVAYLHREEAQVQEGSERGGVVVDADESVRLLQVLLDLELVRVRCGVR